MQWGAPLPDNVADPAALEALLVRALAASPGNPALHAKLGYLHYDRHDYDAAAESFAASLRLGGGDPDLRLVLARCLNVLHRDRDAIEILAPLEEPSFERGRALLETGDGAAAERELRGVLDAAPDDANAVRLLCRLLRKADRVSDIVALCEGLVARGAANAQLLYNMAWALALGGDSERARLLLPRAERIQALELAPPVGFDSLPAFNDALADEILSNPNRVSRFVAEEANRGSSRVDNLFTGRRPELIGKLLARLQQAVSACRPAPLEGDEPWARARPAAARLRPWGLIQRGADFEEGHIHPGGWLSGVYYVRIPDGVARSADRAGWIEFGPPVAVAAALPALAPALPYAPYEGLLLLSPSHYQHRTIPSGLDAHRISVAFDVIPDRTSGPAGA